MQAELWAVTTYFNPCGYKTRRVNYERFLAALTSQGVNCLTVECAFGDDAFELEPSPLVLQIRSDSVMWQKERLLNLGAEALPRECKYVAWIDADVIFENENWPSIAKVMLETNHVVQLFSTCDRLDSSGESVGDDVFSFGAIAPGNQETVCCGRYDSHGHTGYAWAMTRELFNKVGLYELSVIGSSDHFMAHAIYNTYGFCVDNALKDDEQQISHLKEWGNRFYAEVQGKFGCVPGKITHLWHGDLKNRRYFLRMHDVTDLGFNPFTDVHAPPGEPLSWTKSALKKPGLTSYFYNYFADRQEDGEPATGTI